MAEKVKARHAPVHAIEPQVLRQPVVQLVLAGVQALDVLYVSLCGELQFFWGSAGHDAAMIGDMKPVETCIEGNRYLKGEAIQAVAETISRLPG